MSLVPFTYLNIHEFDQSNDNSKNDNIIKYFYVNDKVIKIKEFHEKGIGGKFWDCVRKKIFILFIYNFSQYYYMNILNLIKIYLKIKKY